MKREEHFLSPADAAKTSVQKHRVRNLLLMVFGIFLLGLASAAAMYDSTPETIAPILINVATKVVPLLGDNIPALPSPYGKLHISSKHTDDGTFFNLACEPCRMASPRVGPVPFILPAGKASGVFDEGNFRGALEAEDFKVPIEGHWDGRSFQGTFKLPDTPIAKLYALARSIVPEAGTPEIEGTVSGSGEFQWPQAFMRWKPKVTHFKVSGLVNLSVYSKGTFSYPATDKDDKPIELQSGEGTPDWIPWQGLGKFLPAAAVAAEDGTFYSHPGFDVASMDEALKENEQLKRLRRGASTITQQLAKNLFLSQERSYSRKLRELLYAVNLEQLGKHRILELYLNIVEWAPDVHGAKQAAQVYFQKLPKDLYPEEAAWLAAILRSPERSWKKEFLNGTPNTTRIEKIIRRMPGLTDEERESAIGRKLELAH